MSSTLTKRTLDKMRKEGYLCQVVETFNRFAGVKNDLFGFVDVLCCGENGDIIGIQTTSLSNMRARIDKIQTHKNYLRVKKCMSIKVHGWSKGKNGKRIIWVCDEQEL